MDAIPDFVTHYHLPDRQPFLNLSDLDGPDLEHVMAGLDGRSGQRRFGPRYVALRRATEDLLRTRFVERGGRPERRTPHYFALGESAWFKGLYDDAREVRLSLARLHGLPNSPRPDSYEGHQLEDFEHYVEVQVWSDGILGMSDSAG